MNNDHISTSEIKKDIVDTQNEINDYEDEKEILMKNPVDNRLRIYILEGRINMRREFISKLEKLIKDRRN